MTIASIGRTTVALAIGLGMAVASPGADLGDVRIHACALSMEMFGITKDDLDPLVDDVEGVASFFSEATNGVTFI